MLGRLRQALADIHTVAIRFFRHLVHHFQDEFYIKLVGDTQVLGPILDVLLLTLPRDNLLSSACLDIFEFIRKENMNIKDLLKHVVENYREKLMALSYIETFREIIRANDQSRGYASNMENLFMDSEDELGRRQPHVNGQMMEHINMDPMEEEYWNTSDDEEDAQSKLAARNALGSGPGPLSALVDYHSDEESDENGDVIMKAAERAGAKEAKTGATEEAPEGSSDSEAAAATVPSPPERLSEKRRREEEDEDELGKMMQHKRRNSQSSIQNAAGAAALLRKRKAFGAASSANAAGSRKIDIRLSTPALQSAVGQSPSGQDGGS